MLVECVLFRLVFTLQPQAGVHDITYNHHIQYPSLILSVSHYVYIMEASIQTICKTLYIPSIGDSIPVGSLLVVDKGLS